MREFDDNSCIYVPERVADIDDLDPDPTLEIKLDLAPDPTFTNRIRIRPHGNTGSGPFSITKFGFEPFQIPASDLQPWCLVTVYIWLSRWYSR